MPVTLHRAADAALLSDLLATDAAGCLEAALAARQRASLVVSGGRTPVALFRRLRQLPLDWSRVDVTLADERWVEPEDPASNEALVRRELLQEHAAAARFVPLKVAQPTPLQGATAAWEGIATMPRPFDLVLLGMGDDGHTASLFPGSPQIETALDLAEPPGCIAMTAPVAPRLRLSMNLAAIAASRAVWLHFSGQGKLDLFDVARRLAALVDSGEAPPARLASLPVSAVLRLRGLHPRLYWSA